uniref:Iodothyronine deiodinase n=2 Tax=Ciona intestinalis TaxID=7719 RepID=H2Y0H0_CIOIN
MEKIDHFKKIVRKYSKEKVDFVVIYIAEAHPTDGWSFAGNKYQIHSHGSLEDRVCAAKLFAEQTAVSCPILVDNMANETALKYAAIPERLYILQNGIVKYDGAIGPFGYNLQEMEENLKKCLKEA